MKKFRQTIKSSSRTISTLNNSKIATENNPLYQTIFQNIKDQAETNDLLNNARYQDVPINLVNDVAGFLGPKNGGSLALRYYPTFLINSNVTDPSDIVVQRATGQVVGNLVYVSGQVFITPTAGTTLTIVECSIPVNSKLEFSGDLNGTLAVEGTTEINAGVITGNVGLCTANFRFYSIDTASHDLRYVFSYWLQ